MFGCLQLRMTMCLQSRPRARYDATGRSSEEVRDRRPGQEEIRMKLHLFYEHELPQPWDEGRETFAKLASIG